jgi:polyisoprenoid-binding protein YceI
MFRFATSALLATVALPAFAGTWNLDASHTRVGFSVSHMVVSTVHGQFPGVTGTMQFEPGAVGNLSLNVTVDMNTVDTDNDDRDGHLKAPDFFDVANHPTMTFQSTRVRAKRDGFDVTGNLTIRGVTREVTLHATGLGQTVTDPWGNTRVAAHASGVVNRQDFGVAFSQTIDGGGLLVGDEVTITLDAEFIAASS